MCACCPPQGLFPRHLMAGVLDPANYDAADYRHRFVQLARDRRLRGSHPRGARSCSAGSSAIAESFTDDASDHGIRATPSRWGDAPVSAKAIPLLLRPAGHPADVRALGSGEDRPRGGPTRTSATGPTTTSPAPPAFVTDPLRFDLEPNNFLRIEGHLGKNVQSVLESLLSLKKSHRLPIEVIALRTGAFDESIDVDLSKEECRFQDLETLYETLRAELICFLVKQVAVLLLPSPMQDAGGEEAGRPDARAAEDVRARTSSPQPGTLGFWIESILSWKPGRRPPRFVFPAAGQPSLPNQVLGLVGAMSDLAARLTDDLRQVDFPAVGDRYQTPRRHRPPDRRVAAERSVRRARPRRPAR